MAPAIVDRSASLDALIEPMVKGGYYHAGQVCVSTQRIYVHATLMTAFLERFVARVRALRVGDPLSPQTEVGPLINPREADRVESWVNEAATAGAKILVGGKRLSATTLEPMVLLEPPSDARVSREEVFGPVTCVYSFDQIDDAIERANSLPVAFQASVFAKRYRRCAVCSRSPRCIGGDDQ